ncbi:polyamine ABC transporter substrate-binding protein [Nocardioides euryhalodurans]|uniref:Spermidine/putrescine ABC transporter substrate-binding protein n=1 Tax=Nocardioides euryhalodurans TaxID=2518370 RepID=A0A4P7GHZ3_9ACTN|nr:spermidine/putrescine ABC transporter substrate-binding protein [Nocardioides euryhalodurans]QBR91496.1 spermidine/putrescine ABC transporter substrate-binding protein [Nocardioides euryhalodurans]
MNFDPADPGLRRRRPRPQLGRRDVLRGGLWLGVGLGAAPLLSACGGDGSQGGSGAPYPLARPDSPVTQPIKDSNPGIEDGLDPETGGAFKILNYDQYMAPGVMKAFGEQHGVEVQVTPYTTYDEMLAKLRAPGESFDLVFPGPSVLSKMVYADLLQPLNHSYLPHLENVWPEYQDPWYDQGARYTVPYTIYGTGVLYRADRVSSVPDNGYDLMWDEQHAGKIYLLDDQQEAIAMSLLRNGITTDINTSDPALVRQATDSLIELIDRVQVKANINAYSEVPEGTATIHQAWSGDAIAGQYYLPKGETPEVLAYWRPDDPSEQVIGNDSIAIPASSTKPVLAHLMINDLLDNKIGLRNFGWNGYQPPLTKLSGQYLVDQGYIPSNLVNAVVEPGDFDEGLTFYEVAPSTEALWRQSWSQFKAGG